MHRFRISLVLVVTLASALAGCPSSTTAPSTVPIEDLGGEYGDTFCGILTDCYGDVLREALVGGTEAECAARLTTSYEEGVLHLYEQAIADGTMSYDGTQVRPCIDALQALGCGVLDSRSPPECDEVLIGEVELGGPCSINEQCSGAAYCMNAMACPGTCQPRGGVGTTCSSDEACESPMKCRSGSCVVPAGEGAPCGGTSGNDCAGGLICAGAMMGMTGTCRTPETVQSGALHGACNVLMTQLCQPGLSCVVASFTSMTCEMGDIAIGTACHVAIPDACASGAYCADTNAMMGDLDGTCTALPGVGMPCAMVPFGQQCATDLHCEGDTCRETHAEGGSCTAPSECFSGMCTGGTCAAPMLCE
jgi:hypothetical protein